MTGLYWIGKPTKCPECERAIGDPFLFTDPEKEIAAFYVHCWNNECRAIFVLGVETVKATSGEVDNAGKSTCEIAGLYRDLRSYLNWTLGRFRSILRI